MTTSSKRLALGVILSYCYTIAQVAINLFYVPLLLNGIGRSEYGLYQLIGSLVAYMSVFNLMFQGATTRYYCRYFAQGDKKGMESVLAVTRNVYRVASLVVAGICGIALFVFRSVYSEQLDAFEQSEASVMLIIVTINLIVTMHNSINISAITAHERFAFLKGSQLAVTILQPIAVIAFIQFWPYAMVVSLVQLALNSLCALIQRIYSRRKLKAIPCIHAGYKNLYKEILIFSSGIVLALIADQIFWNSNQLILGYLFGMGVVAVYGIAVQIQRIYMMIGTAISNVFLPKISLLYHNGDSLVSISKEFGKVGKLTAYPLLLVLTGFALFGEDFIVLWVGQDYLDAYWIVLALITPLTIDLVQNVGLSILQVMNKYAFRGKIYFVMSLLNIPIVLLIAPQFGAIGAAVCSGILMLVINGPVMNIYYRFLGIDILSFWKGIARAAAPNACLLVAIFILQMVIHIELSNWLLLIVALVLYATAFIVVSVVFTMTKEERVRLRTLLSGRKMAKRDCEMNVIETGETRNNE